MISWNVYYKTINIKLFGFIQVLKFKNFFLKIVNKN